MRLTFPIYSRDHLHDAIPKFFQRVSCYSNGKPKTLIGHPKPDQTRQLSYFVAKIWHRAPAQVKRRQHSVRGERNNIYSRTYWYHSGHTYGVYAISWSGGEPVQLSEHTTRQLALSALHQINQPGTVSQK